MFVPGAMVAVWLDNIMEDRLTPDDRPLESPAGRLYPDRPYFGVTKPTTETRRLNAFGGS